MAITGYKHYVKGNRFYIDEIVNTGNARQFEGNAKDVLPKFLYVDSTTVFFSGMNQLTQDIIDNGIAFSLIKDENGDPYADFEAYKSFLESELGKSSAGGGATTTLQQMQDADVLTATKSIDGSVISTANFGGSYGGSLNIKAFQFTSRGDDIDFPNAISYNVFIDPENGIQFFASNSDTGESQRIGISPQATQLTGQYIVSGKKDLTTVEYSSSDLNTAYPTAPIGTEIYCADIITGALIYKKIDATDWVSYTVNIV